MSEEESFNFLLDTNIDDWTTRLVYADWLEEHGDCRAEGYRALGINQYTPSKQEEYWGYAFWCHYNKGSSGYIPPDWWAIYYRKRKKMSNRREAEDAAALAYYELMKKATD